MAELLNRFGYAIALLLVGFVLLLVGIFGRKLIFKSFEFPAVRFVPLRISCGVVGGLLMLASGYVWYVSATANPGMTSGVANEQVGLKPSTNGRMLYTAANFGVYSSAAQAQFVPAWQDGISFHIRAELSSITQDAPDYLQFGGAAALPDVNPSNFESLTAEGRILNALAVASTLIQPVNYSTPTDGYQASTTFLSMYGLPDGQQISFPLIKDDEPGGVNFGAITMMNSLSNTWGYYVLIALASKCLAHQSPEKCDPKKLQQVLISARSHLGPNDAFLSSEFSKLIILASR